MVLDTYIAQKVTSDQGNRKVPKTISEVVTKDGVIKNRKRYTVHKTCHNQSYY